MTLSPMTETDPLGEDFTPLSDLARLRKDAENDNPEPIELLHPTMPQYTLLFRGDLNIEEIEGWRKKCVVKAARNGRPDESSPGKFNRMVLAGSSLGIHLDGKDVVDSDGVAVTFRSRDFQRAFDVATGADAVKAFVRHDSSIATLANAVIERNGFGEDAQAPDPTHDAESSQID